MVVNVEIDVENVSVLDFRYGYLRLFLKVDRFSVVGLIRRLKSWAFSLTFCH